MSATDQAVPIHSVRAAGEVDLASLGAAVWRRRKLVLLPTALVAAATFLILSVATPLYRSEARVIIEPRDTTYVRPSGADRDSQLIDEQAVASQVQVLLSRDLGRAVIQKAELTKRVEFDPVAEGLSLPRRLLLLTGLVRDPYLMSAEERVLTRYFERLEVFTVGRSRVVAVSFVSQDADLAARVANTIAEQYLLLQQSAKQSNTRSASTWLAAEIEGLRKQVAEAEARVEEFRAKSGLFLGTNNTSISTQQLGELNTELSRARSQQADAQAKAQMIRQALRSGRPIEASEVNNSELIRRLVEQRVALQATISREARTYLPGHPRMKELQAQLEGMEQQVKLEAAKFARGMENDAQLAAQRIEALQKSIDLQKTQTGTSNEKEVQLRALERDARSQRELLEQLLTRYRDATARESLDALPPDARIVSRAVAEPQPYFPKTGPIMLIATLATLLLGVGVVTAGELMRQPPRPAARHAGAGDLPYDAPEPEPEPTGPQGGRSSRPPLAADRAPAREMPVPQVPGALPVFGRLKQAVERRTRSREIEVEAADARLVGRLAERLAAAHTGGRALHILLSRVSDEVDAGEVGVALARSLAQAGRKVILVDADGTSAALLAAMSAEDLPGLTDIVSAAVTFGEAIHRDRASAAHYLPLGRSAGARMQPERLDVVFDALSLTYDFVIVAGGAADASLGDLTRRCAASILVTAGAGNDPATVAAHDLLADAGIEDVIVLIGPRRESGREGQRVGA